MNSSPSKPAALLAVLIVLATLGACGSGSEARRGLSPVPKFDIEEIKNAGVQKQLQRRRDAVERLLAASKTTDPQLGRAMGELGMVYHAYDYWEQAETLYRNAQQLHPQNYRWSYYLALVQKKLGDFDSAIGNLNHVIDAQPEYPPTYIWLGEFARESGHLNLAERRYRQALKLRPEATTAIVGLGMVALERGKYEEAVTNFTRALELQPEVLSLYFSLAAAYRGLGNRQAMQDALGKAAHLDIAPAKIGLEDDLLFEVESLQISAEQHQIAGLQAIERKDYTTAEAEFRRALALAPYSKDNRFNLAIALVRQKRVNEGEAMLLDLVADDPSYADGHVLLASLYRRDGSLDESTRLSRMEKHLIAATEADPSHQLAQMDLARLYRSSDRPQRALNIYARVREINPNARDAYLQAAATLLGMRRYEASLEQLEDGLKVMPDDPKLRESYTQLREALGMSAR